MSRRRNVPTKQNSLLSNISNRMKDNIPQRTPHVQSSLDNKHYPDFSNRSSDDFASTYSPSFPRNATRRLTESDSM